MPEVFNYSFIQIGQEYFRVSRKEIHIFIYNIYIIYKYTILLNISLPKPTSIPIALTSASHKYLPVLIEYLNI